MQLITYNYRKTSFQEVKQEVFSDLILGSYSDVEKNGHNLLQVGTTHFLFFQALESL
jgi:hypothetical protein